MCLGACLRRLKPRIDDDPPKALSPPKTSEDYASLYELAQASMSNDASVYHNQRHLRDVVVFVREAIEETVERHPAIAERGWRDALIAAAYMHDVAHPAGESRKTIESLTLHVTGRLPSIDATLEQLHSEIGVEFVIRSSSFSKVPPLDRSALIERIAKLIQSTALETYEPARGAPTDPMAIATVLLRCADLSHFTFDLPTHLRRVRALNRELGFVVPRAKHAEFIRTYALPQFEALAALCASPRAEEWLTSVRFKLRYWSELATEDQ